MSVKKRGLGKGLGDLGLKELLNDMSAPATPTTAATQSGVQATAQQPTIMTAAQVISQDSDTPKHSQLRELPIDVLQPGRYQPRRIMDQDGLKELADSIHSQGVIQPIIVRKQTNGKYEIIAGERRWRAAQLAGLDNIPAIVRDIPDEAAIAMALIENIQRRDLNPIEESIALQRLIDEFQMTHQEVAEAVGKSRTGVTNLLRLQKLNPEVKTAVEKGQLEMGHARALLALEGLQQGDVAQQIITRDLSVRETEHLIRKLQAPANANNSLSQRMDPDVARLQTNISEKLGAKVGIQHSAKGKGKLVIHYNTLEELDGILDHIH